MWAPRPLSGSPGRRLPCRGPRFGWGDPAGPEFSVPALVALPALKGTREAGSVFPGVREELVLALGTLPGTALNPSCQLGHRFWLLHPEPAMALCLLDPYHGTLCLPTLLPVLGPRSVPWQVLSVISCALSTLITPQPGHPAPAKSPLSRRALPSRTSAAWLHSDSWRRPGDAQRGSWPGCRDTPPRQDPDPSRLVPRNLAPPCPSLSSVTVELMVQITDKPSHAEWEFNCKQFLWIMGPSVPPYARGKSAPLFFFPPPHLTLRQTPKKYSSSLF